MTTIANKTFKFNRECQECGDKFGTDRGNARFCSTTHRKDFNNRRAVRGAQVYDFLMLKRYDRKALVMFEGERVTTEQAARVMMDRLAEMFNEADKEVRGGRRSFQSFKHAMHDIPLARSQGAGDGR
jgi:hypothetical protein